MEIKGLPKISVLVITYNQEDLIGRALESILIQKEYLHEIIISDDCSTDNNWDVINRYAQQNPNFVKPFRNKHNLGIFGNMESLYSKPTGDIVFWLSGDDTFCDGLFAKAIHLIEKNKIDYKNELFCLYFDYKMLYPDGSSIIYSNKVVTKGHNLVSLKLRQLISNRTTGYSVNILKNLTPVRKDIVHYTDLLQEIQLQMLTTNNYYCPFVGSIYYAAIGVSVKCSRIENYNSRALMHKELIHLFNLSKEDRYYLRFMEEQTLLSISFSIKHAYNTIYYFLKSIDFKLGFEGLQISRIFFVVKKRWRNNYY